MPSFDVVSRTDMAEVVAPACQRKLDRVFFGATVTYVGADGGATRAYPTGKGWR